MTEIDDQPVRFVQKRAGREILIQQTTDAGSVFGVGSIESQAQFQVRQMIGAALTPGRYRNPAQNSAPKVDQWLIDFASGNALDLSISPDVVDQAPATQLFDGTVRSGLITGDETHRQVEIALARFYRLQSALILNSEGDFVSALERAGITVPDQVSLSQLKANLDFPDIATSQAILVDERESFCLDASQDLSHFKTENLLIFASFYALCGGLRTSFVVGSESLIGRLRQVVGDESNLTRDHASYLHNLIVAAKEDEKPRTDLNDQITKFDEGLIAAGLGRFRQIGSSFEIFSGSVAQASLIAEDLCSRRILVDLRKTGDSLQRLGSQESGPVGRVFIRVANGHTSDHLFALCDALHETSRSLGLLGKTR